MLIPDSVTSFITYRLPSRRTSTAAPKDPCPITLTLWKLSMPGVSGNAYRWPCVSRRRRIFQLPQTTIGIFTPCGPSIGVWQSKPFHRSPMPGKMYVAKLRLRQNCGRVRVDNGGGRLQWRQGCGRSLDASISVSVPYQVRPGTLRRVLYNHVRVALDNCSTGVDNTEHHSKRHVYKKE